MKVDHSYIKLLLQAFENSEKPTTDINELITHGIDYNDDNYLFHIRILQDKGFVEGLGSDDLGFKMGSNGHIVVIAAPLRLTAKGHDFIANLKNQEVWESIKTNFKDVSTEALWSISKDLTNSFIQKKIQKILDD